MSLSLVLRCGACPHVSSSVLILIAHNTHHNVGNYQYCFGGYLLYLQYNGPKTLV